MNDDKWKEIKSKTSHGLTSLIWKYQKKGYKYTGLTYFSDGYWRTSLKEKAKNKS